MELNSKQKRRRILLEIKDILLGAAFPLMLQLILSTTIIMFADFSGDAAIRAFALVFGEILLIAAYVIFGRQNGVSAYRKMTITKKKREMQTTEVEAYYKTGEYAIWKSFVIGLVSVIPYILVQFIHCLAPNIVCEFLLKYAFGWAAYPFIVFGVDIQWLNFIWIIIPVGTHAAAYCFAGYKEAKRQEILAQAQNIKGKKKNEDNRR